MNTLNGRNIFKEINYKIASKCNSIDEIYEKIPFPEDEIGKYIELQKSFPTSAVAPIIGRFIGAAAVVGVSNQVSKNIFNKINKNSKNQNNFNFEDDDWGTILINKSMEELLESIKFNTFSIHTYLNNLKVYKAKTRKEIMEGSNHRDKYIEAVFASDKAKFKRHPSRDCIIGLSFAFELNLLETNYLLKAAGYNELYLRNKRDLIITKSILEEFDIKKLNEYLIEQNEDKIGNFDDNEVCVVQK